MNQRGRKSAAALAVVDDGPGLPALRPPPGLTEAERGVWLATVNSKPADWFGCEHVPILVEYVRHVCRGHVIDEQLKLFDAVLIESDLGRYKKLVSLAGQTANMINRLASSMRLTQHSAYRNDKVMPAIPTSGGKLWQREAA